MLSVKEIARRHTVFSEASLRWFIFMEHQNGLKQSGAVIRLGRKVLIDEEKFIAWLRGQNSNAAAA